MGLISSTKIKTTKNGGIIGPNNVTSFGTDKITGFTSSGNHTTRAGTSAVLTAIVSGGGGGGADRAGGGGGGGLLVTTVTGL